MTGDTSNPDLAREPLYLRSVRVLSWLLCPWAIYMAVRGLDKIVDPRSGGDPVTGVFSILFPAIIAAVWWRIQRALVWLVSQSDHGFVATHGRRQLSIPRDEIEQVVFLGSYVVGGGFQVARVKLSGGSGPRNLLVATKNVADLDSLFRLSA